MGEKVMGKFQKNATEWVHVSLVEYRGHELVDMRVYYEDSDGEWKPSRKGLTLSRTLLPELVMALQAAQREG